MPTLLVIPDIHHRTRQAQAILDYEAGYSRAVFLGDFLDGWGDDWMIAMETARWVAGLLEDPRHIPLWGNHDLPYAYPTNGWVSCSGWTEEKSAAVNRILSADHWGRFRLTYAVPEFSLLFSHAGISSPLFGLMASIGEPVPKAPYTADSIQAWIDEISPSIAERLQAGRPHQLLEAGRSRGGMARIGGVTWEDFTQHVPIPGMAQVIGHTIQQPDPLFRFPQGSAVHPGTPMWRRASAFQHSTEKQRSLWLPQGFSLCLDTNSHHYATVDLDTGTLDIKQVKWGGSSCQFQYAKSICRFTLPRANGNLAGYQAIAQVDAKPS